MNLDWVRAGPYQLERQLRNQSKLGSYAVQTYWYIGISSSNIMNPAKTLDPAFLKFSGLEHSRCHNHEWAIIKEINDALDSQELLRNQRSLPTNGASKSTEVESVVPKPHDDDRTQDKQEVTTRKPDFTDRFQYMSFSCGPFLRCVQTHCMGHPRSTPKTRTPTLLSTSEVKEEVKVETV
jgi:hypothetical protein